MASKGRVNATPYAGFRWAAEDVGKKAQDSRRKTLGSRGKVPRFGRERLARSGCCPGLHHNPFRDVTPKWPHNGARPPKRPPAVKS